jgi:hypothetical protein
MNARIWDDDGQEIAVDREFQNLIPAISNEERQQLEANIVEFGGARDPLTAWVRGDDDLVLLDGHNRYEICRRLKLPFRYVELRLDTREDAADWIDRNQLGRRNLSRQDYKLLLGRRYNRAKRANGGDRKSEGQNAPVKERTSAKLAKEHGVDEKTVRRAGKFQQAVEKLDLQGDIVRGTVRASEAEVVAAAAAIGNSATAEQKAAARAALKQRRTKTATKTKGPQAKPAAVTSTDAVTAEIRSAAEKAWQRLKDKFPPDEHTELRKVLAGIIREEQKQLGK